MDINEKRKDVVESREWLREQLKEIRYPQPGITKYSVRAENRLSLRLKMGALSVFLIIVIATVIVWNREPDGKEVSADKAAAAVNGKTTPAPAAVEHFAAKTVAATDVELPNDIPDKAASPMLNVYPSGWPDEIRYPAQFTVLDAGTVQTNDNALPAYAVKMRFAGDMQTAAESFAAHFEKHGWQIVERSELDDGDMKNIQIKVARNDERDSGNVIIEPDPQNTDKVRIVAVTFF